MKKIVLSSVFLLVSIIGFSQTESAPKDLKIRFGFNLGLNRSNLQSKEALPDNAKIVNGIGFCLGITMDYFLSKKLMFSPQAVLSFYSSGVEFSNPGASNVTYSLFPACIELMTHMNYKIGKGNMVPYLVAGPSCKLPLNKKSKTGPDLITSPDIAIDIGIGLEKKMLYFALAPELRYSFGLLNVNNNPALQTLNFHSVSLVFNFK